MDGAITGAGFTRGTLPGDESQKFRRVGAMAALAGVGGVLTVGDCMDGKQR